MDKINLNALDELIDAVEDPKYFIYFDPKDGLGYIYDVEKKTRELLPFADDADHLEDLSESLASQTGKPPMKIHLYGDGNMSYTFLGDSPGVPIKGDLGTDYHKAAQKIFELYGVPYPD